MVALALALAVGCDWPGKPNPADQPVLPDKVLQPERLFAANCAGCHGAEGKGGPAPPLNDPVFRAIVSEKELVGIITRGRSGTPMPGFAQQKGNPPKDAQEGVQVKAGPLTTEQIQKLAQAIKTGEFTPSWGPAAKAEGLPPYLPKSAGDPQAGKEVFARVCQGCHGENGKGGDMAGAINQPAFLALISEQALRRIVITGRPDLVPAMPSPVAPEKPEHDFKPLSDKEVDDVVALLASWRPGGSGKGK